jgi:hypothetical protein
MRAEFAGLLLLLPVGAHAAAPLLPYSTRTWSYSGWSTTVHGDIRTLGMAGATVGLADSFIGTGDNPAGLAMTLGGGGVQVTRNRIHDAYVQDYGEVMSSTNLGATSTIYPWGFSLGYWVPNSEEQRYQFGAGGPEGRAEVFTREFRFSAGRILLDNKLSLGASVIFGQAAKSLEIDNSPALDSSHHSHAPGASVGAMYQLPKRWILGATYVFPMTFHADPLENTSPVVAGFHQPVRSPYRVGVGVGWIPNRFFQAGATVLLIGATSGVALLSDESLLVGENVTIQPRIGATYRAAELKELEVKVSAGTYLEVSRIRGTGSRLHVTGGLEVNPWIFNFGWGVDESARYENFIYSAGIDVIRLMRKLDLIPQPWRPPRGGWLPRPTYYSDEGLARPLVAHWVDRHEKNVIQISKELPGKLEEKVRKTGEQVGEGVEAISEGVGKGVEAIGEGVEALGKGVIEGGGTVLDAFKSIPGRLKREMKKTRKRQEKESKKPE